MVKTIIETHTKINFSDQYKESIFFLWYKNGRCHAGKLHHIMSFDEWGNKPTEQTLMSWITDFKSRADEMDEIVRQEMEGRLVKEKVEMMSRHAKVGQRMQDVAIEWIETNQNLFTAPAAVRLLVEGVRIERLSRGIPEMLESMLEMSDEDLLKQIEETITRSPVKIEEIEE